MDRREREGGSQGWDKMDFKELKKMSKKDRKNQKAKYCGTLQFTK
jgi:hypothetical protein